MKHLYLLLFVLFTFSLLSGCGKTEFSPNQKFGSDTPQDLNKANIAKLMAQAKDDTIRFVLTGDTQRAYAACEDMVIKVNGIQGVDFVMIDGDISDFGLFQEMEWVNAIYSKLKVPYIGVLGNHDISANGKQVFERMYGSENFCFVYDSVKFVCHDSNSREYNFNGSIPNINWLKSELKPQQGVEGYVAVSHVPAFTDDFDYKLEQEYASTLINSDNFIASLNAHVNKTQVLYPYDDSTPFMVVNTAAKREFFLIDIVNGEISYKLINF